MKKEAGRRTVIRVMAVLFVGIMAGTVAASGVSRGEGTEMALCYEDLENLVKESCPQVEMERRQFEERLGRLEDAREELLESRRALREEASDREKDGDAAALQMAGRGPFGWRRQPERTDPSGWKCRRTDGAAQDGGYHALDGSEPDGNV